MSAGASSRTYSRFCRANRACSRGDGLGSCALAIGDGVDNGAVLGLRANERAPEGVDFRLLFEKGAGRRERQARHALRFAPYNVAGQAPQRLVKLGVQLDIGVEIHVLLAAFYSDIEFIDELAQCFEFDLGDPAFGRDPCRRAFDHAAQFDGIDHVLTGEAPDRIAAGGDGLDQTFLAQL